VLRKIGIVLTAAGVVFFVISFLHIITGSVPSECGGAECLRGENRWLLALPASVFAFVGGVIMISYGGRGYGKTRGPRTFEDVDSGAWKSRANVSPGAGSAGESRVLRWSRTWRNIYILTAIGELGLAILFVIGGFAQHAAASGLFLTAGILGAVGLILGAVGVRAAAKDRLHSTGIEGEARIVAIEQTGMWMNNNPYVKLDLMITVPGHPPYELKHGEIVPQVLLGRLTDGSTLSVRVDPNKPSHFVVEWERA
jgi:hypothetical protein